MATNSSMASHVALVTSTTGHCTAPQDERSDDDEYDESAAAGEAETRFCVLQKDAPFEGPAGPTANTAPCTTAAATLSRLRSGSPTRRTA